MLSGVEYENIFISSAYLHFFHAKKLTFIIKNTNFMLMRVKHENLF